MGDELDINIIKATQNALGKYVKRPPLTEKLLKKPPFRFLHDIVTSVLKSTGFFNGLFEEDELISENVKDRDSKILFLSKVITVVGTTVGKRLPAKPSKIIAGQEPEKTNELLQSIALALDKKISSDEAVQLYKTSTNVSSNDKQVKEIKKSTKKVNETKANVKSNDKLIAKTDNIKNVKSKEKNVKKDTATKKTSQTIKIATKKNPEKNVKENKDSKDVDSVNNEPLHIHIPSDNENILLTQNSLSSTDVQPSSNLDENRDGNINNANSISESDILLDEEKSIGNQQSTEELKIKEENETDINKKESAVDADLKSDNNVIEGTTTLSKKLSSDKNNRTLENNQTTPETKNTPEVTRPTSVRPPSSRPGAPRIRDKYEEVIAESDTLLMGKVNIIAESTVHEEEDESSIIILDDTEKLNTKKEELDIPPNEHGHLVQQILESQKEFSQVLGKTEIDWQYGAKKAKDVLYQEIEQLRFNVQALSRVANPLGKLLDHIQEDVEVMRQELQQWSKIYESTSKDLMKQKAVNEEMLQPYHSRIRQLDADISERHEKIDDLKIIIHKNAHRIEKLLAKGNMQ